MNRSIAVAVVLFALGSIAVTGQSPDKPRQGFLSTLKAGQAISVKEASGRFEIGIVEDFGGTLGYKVTDVGEDFVTVVDIAGVSEIRIPIYSIKSVVRVQIPKGERKGP